MRPHNQHTPSSHPLDANRLFFRSTPRTSRPIAHTDAFGYRSPSSFISNATAAGSGTSASGGILAGTTSGGNTSPGHRQSLRDYDEQLNTLRRENFNLKLRIYFLESNGVPGVAGGVGGSGGGAAQSAGAADAAKEALYKQNVDLKVCVCVGVIAYRLCVGHA